MFLSGLSLNFIIHESCNIVLQILSNFIDICLVCTSTDMKFELIVSLYYLSVGICKIILTSHRVRHGNRRSNGGWSNRQIFDNHPLRSSECRFKTHKLTVFI